jgi:hypothetical protein
MPNVENNYTLVLFEPTEYIILKEAPMEPLLNQTNIEIISIKTNRKFLKAAFVSSISCFATNVIPRKLFRHPILGYFLTFYFN